MNNLEQEAKQHLSKLEQSLEYHKNKLAGETRQGVKFMIEKEISALEFVMTYAKEALSQRGITL